MTSQLGFVAKVVLLSVAIAALIKYAAPVLAIPATSVNAFIGVITPLLLLAAALAWQSRRAAPPHEPL